MPRLRIQFVLPSLHLTGGVRVAFEHARGLRRRGHQVLLSAPVERFPPPALPGGRLAALKHYFYSRWSGRTGEALRSYELGDAVRRFDPERPAQAPEADVTLATSWNTAEWVHTMPAARAGRRYYFLQGYEAWNEEIRPRVDATWRLPLRLIVVARWLERLAREKFGVDAWARVPNGVDPERFRPASEPEGAGSAAPIRVGMPYDLSPWKGTPDGLAALGLIHSEAPRAEFVLVGRARLRDPVPPGTRYFRDLPQSRLREAYQAADIFLCPSLMEGFSLVTLESMACGCALVATAVGEVPEMGRPGDEYLVTPPGDPAALAAAALRLLRDPPLLAAVRRSGLLLARRYGWEGSTALLEAALLRDDAPGTSTSR